MTGYYKIKSVLNAHKIRSCFLLCLKLVQSVFNELYLYCNLHPALFLCLQLLSYCLACTKSRVRCPLSTKNVEFRLQMRKFVSNPICVIRHPMRDILRDWNGHASTQTTRMIHKYISENMVRTKSFQYAQVCVLAQVLVKLLTP